MEKNKYILASLDIVADDHIQGWAVNLYDPDFKVQIEVRYNNKLIAASFANLMRADIEKIGICANCGFNINYGSVKDVSLLTIVARVSGYIPVNLSKVGNLYFNEVEKVTPVVTSKWIVDHTLRPVDDYVSPRLENYAFRSTDELFRQTGYNTGNIIHEGGLCRIVNSIPIKTLPTTLGTDTILVMSPANQLGEHTDNSGWAKQLRNSSRPICVVGLGAQSDIDFSIPKLKKGTLDWISAILENAPSHGVPNISLRGFFTEEVLSKHGFKDIGCVTGCHSFFINPIYDLGRKVANKFKRPKRIAVAAGGYWIHHMRNIERNLVRLVSETNGSYIGQSELNMLKLCRNEFDQIDPPKKDIIKDYLFQNFSQLEVEDWIKVHGKVFFNIDAWMEHLKRFDFVIGSRIHGIIIALQAGIPAMCIAIDSRTRELCEVMKIPYLRPSNLPDPLTLDDIARIFKFDPEEFDRNRQMLARRLEMFLENNYISINRKRGKLLEY